MWTADPEEIARRRADLLANPEYAETVHTDATFAAFVEMTSRGGLDAAVAFVHGLCQGLGTQRAEAARALALTPASAFLRLPARDDLAGFVWSIGRPRGMAATLACDIADALLDVLRGAAPLGTAVPMPGPLVPQAVQVCAGCGQGASDPGGIERLARSIIRRECNSFGDESLLAEALLAEHDARVAAEEAWREAEVDATRHADARLRAERERDEAIAAGDRFLDQFKDANVRRWDAEARAEQAERERDQKRDEAMRNYRWGSEMTLRVATLEAALRNIATGADEVGASLSPTSIMRYARAALGDQEAQEAAR